MGKRFTRMFANSNNANCMGMRLISMQVVDKRKLRKRDLDFKMFNFKFLQNMELDWHGDFIKDVFHNNGQVRCFDSIIFLKNCRPHCQRKGYICYHGRSHFLLLRSSPLFSGSAGLREQLRASLKFYFSSFLSYSSSRFWRVRSGAKSQCES